MKSLEIKHITKSFGAKQVLKDVSFSCNTGDIIGIFGRNGCGKSTLLKAIFGTLTPDVFEVELNKRSVASGEIITQKLIAYLPQDNFLPKELKVRDVIPLFFSKGEDQDKIFYSEGVAVFDNTKVGNLSSGELRYLEILLLVHLKHPFMMLDEPFTMVEPLYKIAIQKLLRSFSSTKGFILTDHYYLDVLEISSRNFVLTAGKLHEVNNTEDLIEHKYLNPS